MTPESVIAIIRAAILAARTLAIVAGVLVLLDSFKIVTGIERPQHHPQGNAIAWGIIAAAALIGASGLLYFGEINSGLSGNLWGEISALIVWAGFAAGLSYRDAIRSLRPRLIVKAAALFFLAGFALATMEAL